MIRSGPAILVVAFLNAVLLGPISEVVASEPKSLAEVEEFAFGGVGVAGIESQGERFFRTAMDEADAVATFKKILGSGTPAAKLYALCGIRLLSQNDFPSAAEPLLKSNDQVTTIHGCMLTKERVSEVTRQISAGSFDITLKNPTRWPNQR